MKKYLKMISFVSLYLASIFLAVNYGRIFSDDILYQDTYEVKPKIWLTAELRRQHPFLAEYQRIIKLSYENRQFSINLGVDSGGHPDIRVYYQDDKLFVASINGLWTAFDTNKNELYIERSKISPTYLGKFTFFNYGGFKNWRFVEVVDGEHEDPYTLKGG